MKKIVPVSIPYSIILGIAVLLTSCSTVKNVQHIKNGGNVLKESSAYYVNDSLSFSCRFPGCYKQIENEQEIKENVIKVNKNLPLKNCIACFRDFDPPYYDRSYFLFYFPEKQFAHHKLLKSIRKFLPNSDIDKIKYVEGEEIRMKDLGELEKTSFDFYVDENKYIVGKDIPLENNKGAIYLIGSIGKKDYSQFFNHKINFDNTVNSIITSEQYRDISFSSPFDIAREWEISEDTTVNYLMPVYLLKSNEQNYTDKMNRGMWVQAFGTYLSRLSNKEKEVLENANEFRNPVNPRYKMVSSENALQTNEEALTYLIQKCKEEYVVMINENHFTPHHRILGEILLDSLYNYGFRYLAMEAVFDTVLNNRGFATTNSGFYTREPMMANLIRKAIEKGYYVFGYDDFTSNREKEQALNIYKKTLLKDSLSKVLVFAGFQHIDETESSKNWMAREFFLLTGIDPLTINQTEYVTEDAFLMILDSGTLKYKNMSCDVFIANNIDYDLFASKSGYKEYNITIPKEIVEQAKTQLQYRDKQLLFMVSVFKDDEYRKDRTAIPVYNYVLENDLSDFSIKLLADKYYYVVKDRFGKVVFEGDIQ